MSSKRNPQLAAALKALPQKRCMGSLGRMVLRVAGNCIWMSQSSYLGNAAGRDELQLRDVWLCKSSGRGLGHDACWHSPDANLAREHHAQNVLTATIPCQACMQYHAWCCNFNACFQCAHTLYAGKRQNILLTISTILIQSTVKTIIDTKEHLQSRAGKDSVLNMSSGMMQRCYYL